MSWGARGISRGEGSHAHTEGVSRLTLDKDFSYSRQASYQKRFVAQRLGRTPTFSSLIYETESGDWTVIGFLSKFFKDRKGYKRFSDSGIPVHRYVAAKKLGRNLKKREEVHHKNRNKTDNRRANLWVFPSHKKHDSAHRRDKKRFGKWWPMFPTQSEFYLG